MSVPGEFVALFPIHGQSTFPRLRREAMVQLAALVQEHQITVLSDWRFSTRILPDGGRVLRASCTASSSASEDEAWSRLATAKATAPASGVGVFA